MDKRKVFRRKLTEETVLDLEELRQGLKVFDLIPDNILGKILVGRRAWDQGEYMGIITGILSAEVRGYTRGRINYEIETDEGYIQGFSGCYIVDGFLLSGYNESFWLVEIPKEIIERIEDGTGCLVCKNSCMNDKICPFFERDGGE